MNIELSFAIPTSNNSTQVALGASNTQSGVIFPTATFNGPNQCLLLGTVDFWVVRGTNPIALADGTSMRVPGGMLFRTSMSPGERLGVIAVSGTGTLHITPVA